MGVSISHRPYGFFLLVFPPQNDNSNCRFMIPLSYIERLSELGDPLQRNRYSLSSRHCCLSSDLTMIFRLHTWEPVTRRNQQAIMVAHNQSDHALCLIPHVFLSLRKERTLYTFQCLFLYLSRKTGSDYMPPVVQYPFIRLSPTSR
jgi:hypothetical protein